MFPFFSHSTFSRFESTSFVTKHFSSKFVWLCYPCIFDNSKRQKLIIMPNLCVCVCVRGASRRKELGNGPDTLHHLIVVIVDVVAVFYVLQTNTRIGNWSSSSLRWNNSLKKFLLNTKYGKKHGTTEHGTQIQFVMCISFFFALFFHVSCFLFHFCVICYSICHKSLRSKQNQTTKTNSHERSIWMSLTISLNSLNLLSLPIPLRLSVVNVQRKQDFLISQDTKYTPIVLVSWLVFFILFSPVQRRQRPHEVVRASVFRYSSEKSNECSCMR